VFHAAKTVADCFKYRRKVGLESPIEALQDFLREKEGAHQGDCSLCGDLPRLPGHASLLKLPYEEDVQKIAASVRALERIQRTRDWTARRAHRSVACELS